MTKREDAADAIIRDLLKQGEEANRALRAVAGLILDGCPMWSTDPANYCNADRAHAEWTRQFVDDLHRIVYPFTSDLLAPPEPVDKETAINRALAVERFKTQPKRWGR